MAARVNTCGVVKHCPQEVRDKWRALKEAALNYPDQLEIHILETTTSEIHVAFLIWLVYLELETVVLGCRFVTVC